MIPRNYLKQCICGVQYWGNNEDRACLECSADRKARFTESKCACGCGKEFLREIRRNPIYEKKYFNRACQMRARRRTESGKAYMELYNKRYKRAMHEWLCKFPSCGKKVISARRRKYCDEHSR